uniref:Reverse transcriptase domain-containing protein n=2 Tax=Lutzomyia longipalpis TaxID=7200 RepID=A0A1B0C8M7_LUTLO
MGDININTISPSSSSEYESLLAEHGLRSLVNEPTRIFGAASTCLDHVYCRCSPRWGDGGDARVLHFGITDHSTVVLNVGGALSAAGISREANASRPPKIRTDYGKLNACLRREAWTDVAASTDVDTAFRVFISRVTDNINKCSSSGSRPGRSRRRRPIKPWMTGDLCARIQKKYKLKKLARRHPSNERLAVYSKNYSKRVCADVKSAKESYYAAELERAGNDYGRCWEVVNEITGRMKKRSVIQSVRSMDGEMLTERTEICNEMNNFFVTAVRDLSSDVSSELTHVREPAGRTFFLAPVTTQDVMDAIRGLRSKSAAGMDGITSDLLKRISLSIVDILTSLINLSFVTGKFPEALKRVLVVPVFKKGDTRLLNNYRPITLVSSISKVMEKIMHKRIYGFLSDMRLLSPLQFGFRKGCGCEDAMLRLFGELSETLNRPKGACASVLFLDLTKAFDLVRQDVLMAKLENVGIRGVAAGWLESYLRGRVQCVRIGGDCLSAPEVCEYGVPQGSVLGPLLFVIYLDDLLCSDLLGSITAYADDMALLYSGGTRDEVNVAMQRDLAYIRRWLDAHGMVLSTKTVLMDFGRDTNQHNDLVSHSATCGRLVGGCSERCVRIERVQQFKYLGLIVDAGLTWHAHMDAVRTSVRQVTRQLYALRRSCSGGLMRAVYCALVESKLRYGIALWGNAAATHMHGLLVAQKGAVRVMSFARRTDASAPLFAGWRLLPLRHLYVERVARLAGGDGNGRCLALGAAAGGREPFNVPRPRTEQFKRSFNYSAPIILNNLSRRLSSLAPGRVGRWLCEASVDMVAELLRSMYS